MADQNDRVFFGGLSTEERHQMDRILKAIIEKKALKHIPLE
ncbi:hypothetical protein [Vampirovibrio sp.]